LGSSRLPQSADRDDVESVLGRVRPFVGEEREACGESSTDGFAQLAQTSEAVARDATAGLHLARDNFTGVGSSELDGGGRAS
jgi:hypothetical protein